MISNKKARQEFMEEWWDESFKEQIDQNAYNTAPVEALVRFTAQFLRARYENSEQIKQLKFLEVGCGAGANLIWLAEKGLQPNGIDISQKALDLCKYHFQKNQLEHRLGDLKRCSATSLPFEKDSFDGVLESCVFQHLNEIDRKKAHQEVVRVLKPGGAFIGHMLSQNHTTYQLNKGSIKETEPGTLVLKSEEAKNKINLEAIGLSHFFSKDEYNGLLKGCSLIDPCETTYELPLEEAARRGYKKYYQAMWIVYAIK